MKKGDATMVAAVLLIVSTIVIGLLVASFSRETEKKVEKRILTMGNVIECNDVGIGIEEIDSQPDGTVDIIKLTNKGTLGINKIAVRDYFESGAVGGQKKIEEWGGSDINGNGKLDPIKEEFYNYGITTDINKIEFIPIIFTDSGGEIGCENKIVTWER